MLKKIILQVFAVCLSITLSLSMNAEIEYRLAQKSDLSSLQSIYTHEIDEIDAQKLVILPRIAIQMASIVEAINNKQLYVAYDTTTNTVLSFLKIYLIPNETMVEDVLSNEIRGLGNRKVLEFSRACYFANPQSLLDHSLSDFTADDTTKQDFVYSPETQLFLYYGCQFTRHAFRNQHLSTRLLHTALGYLQQSICRTLRETAKNTLVTLYGQVASNTHQIGIIKSIGSFVNDIRNNLNYSTQEEIHLAHLGYRAYKPAFVLEDNGALNVLPDSDEQTITGRGIGNILAFTFFR